MYPIKEEKRLTQADLAERMGIAPASVNKWMSGGTPAIDKLPQLCDILEITPNELFGYEQEGLPQEAIDLYKASSRRSPQGPRGYSEARLHTECTYQDPFSFRFNQTQSLVNPCQQLFHDRPKLRKIFFRSKKH